MGNSDEAIELRHAAPVERLAPNGRPWVQVIPAHWRQYQHRGRYRDDQRTFAWSISHQPWALPSPGKSAARRSRWQCRQLLPKAVARTPPDRDLPPEDRHNCDWGFLIGTHCHGGKRCNDLGRIQQFHR